MQHVPNTTQKGGNKSLYFMLHFNDIDYFLSPETQQGSEARHILVLLGHIRLSGNIMGPDNETDFQ